MEQATQTPVTNMSLKELQALVLQLQERIVILETPKAKSDAGIEMTDEHARRILTGDLAQTKHRDAAEKLGLSYGQVYSCRLEFTFKHIHKEMAAAKVANPWKK
jgi:hypothetical protein